MTAATPDADRARSRAGAGLLTLGLWLAALALSGLAGCAPAGPDRAGPGAPSPQAPVSAEHHPIGDKLSLMVLRRTFGVATEGGTAAMDRRVATLTREMGVAMRREAATEAQRRRAEAFVLSIEQDRTRFGPARPDAPEIDLLYDVDVMVLFFERRDQAPEGAYVTERVLAGTGG